MILETIRPFVRLAAIQASVGIALLLISTGSDSVAQGSLSSTPQKPSDCALLHPTIDERPLWDKLAQSKEGELFIKTAEDLLKEHLSQDEGDIDALYLDFMRSGDRAPYFKPYFRRDRLLWELSFAESLENKGRFVPHLENVIRKVCAERTWVLPCHDLDLKNFNGERIDIDLCSSQRGATLAIVNALMGRHLSPETRTLIEENVDRRVLTPFKKMVSGEVKRNWWIDSDCNWNAVCLANIAAAGLYSAKTPGEQAFFIDEPCKLIKKYLSGFSPDGYCTEGVGYWTYGFGHYIYFSEIIRRASNGRVDPMLWPEAKIPALFPFSAEIVNQTYPVFADCPLRNDPDKRFLGYVSRRFDLGLKDYENAVEKPSGEKAISLGDLNYILCFPELAPWPVPTEKTVASAGFRTWFETAGILICRGKDGVKSYFGAAFKGGVNAGNHHHTDIGSYTVVHGRAPVITDPGMEVYTKRTFSKDRLQSKVINSYGHPVPVIDGQLQRDGADAKAAVLSSKFTDACDEITFDIKSAYDVKKLKSLVRTFRFNRNPESVEIEDAFEFDKPGSFENALISFGEMEKLSEGKLKLAWNGKALTAEVSSDCGSVSVSSERIQEELPSKLKALRVALKLNAPALKGCVKVKISPEK